MTLVNIHISIELSVTLINRTITKKFLKRKIKRYSIRSCIVMLVINDASFRYLKIYFTDYFIKMIEAVFVISLIFFLSFKKWVSV